MNFFELFNKYGIVLNDEQYLMFDTYYNILIKENEKYNLTTIVNKEDVWLKHFLDSVLPNKQFKTNCTILDIGGGAGFPSIALKIIRPDLRFVVIDSVEKKTKFMQMVVNKLGLCDIEILHARCEDLSKEPKYRESFDYVIARAVAPLTTLLEYCVPFCKVSGQLVLYKGDKYLEEINNTTNTCRLLDCSLMKIDKVYIDEGDYIRYFLIYEKNSSTLLKYPRGQNKPRNNPLN